MSKTAGAKLRILHLLRIFWEHTDEDHTLTMPEILDLLEGQGIEAERRAVYGDIEALRSFGFDIERRKTKTYDYCLASRDFELPELKLLVDAVQASSFITSRKTNQLIRKIERLASGHQAVQLSRQVHIEGRVKSMNESIYYHVDRIHQALLAGCRIRFQYQSYGPDKKLHLRRAGTAYEVSPYLLCWDMGYYYLVGYNHNASRMAHFRVDKMARIDLEEGRPRAQDKHLDPARYARSVFGMFTGDEQEVAVRFDDDLAGAVIDRFGRETPFTDCQGGGFTAHLRVAVSPPFFGWLFQFGGKAKILSPQSVAEEAHRLAGELERAYRR